MRKIRETIKGSIGDEFYNLWLEYENQSSKEAKLVKDLDRFEMIVQALEYEKAQPVDVEEFFTTTRGTFKHPQVMKWVEELEKQRSEFKSTTEKKESKT